MRAGVCVWVCPGAGVSGVRVCVCVCVCVFTVLPAALWPAVPAPPVWPLSGTHSHLPSPLFDPPTPPAKLSGSRETNHVCL